MPDSPYKLEAEIDRLRVELGIAKERLAEERRQRESFSQVLDVVTQTRGGSRAWMLTHSVADEVLRDRGGVESYGNSPVANGKGFHWKGGLYFWRDFGGNVRIIDWRRVMTDEGEVVWCGQDICSIDGNGWASIVASVSAQGETGERWQQMRDFHNLPCISAQPIDCRGVK